VGENGNKDWRNSALTLQRRVYHYVFNIIDGHILLYFDGQSVVQTVTSWLRAVDTAVREDEQQRRHHATHGRNDDDDDDAGGVTGCRRTAVSKLRVQ